MSSPEESVLTFDIREMITLQPVHRLVKEVVDLELTPEVSVHAESEHVSIRGYLVVQGAYLAEGDTAGDDGEAFQLTDYDTDEDDASEASGAQSAERMEQEALYPIFYRIPLEISVAAYRAPRLEDVRTEVGNLDFALKEENRLELFAELAVYGIHQGDPPTHSEVSPQDSPWGSSGTESPWDAAVTPVSGTHPQRDQEAQKGADEAGSYLPVQEKEDEEGEREGSGKVPGRSSHDEKCVSEDGAGGREVSAEETDVNIKAKIETKETNTGTIDAGIEQSQTEDAELEETETFRVLATNPEASAPLLKENTLEDLSQERGTVLSVGPDLDDRSIDSQDDAERAGADSTTNVIPLQKQTLSHVQEAQKHEIETSQDGDAGDDDKLRQRSLPETEHMKDGDSQSAFQALVETSQGSSQESLDNREEIQEEGLEFSEDAAETVFKVSISSKRHQEENDEGAGHSFSHLFMKSKQEAKNSGQSEDGKEDKEDRDAVKPSYAKGYEKDLPETAGRLEKQEKKDIEAEETSEQEVSNIDVPRGLSNYLSSILANREEKTVSIRFYRFQSKDSLSELAEAYDVDLQDLLQVNRLTENQELKEGALVWIPPKKKARR